MLASTISQRPKIASQDVLAVRTLADVIFHVGFQVFMPNPDAALLDLVVS